MRDSTYICSMVNIDRLIISKTLGSTTFRKQIQTNTRNAATVTVALCHHILSNVIEKDTMLEP